MGADCWIKRRLQQGYRVFIRKCKNKEEARFYVEKLMNDFEYIDEGEGGFDEKYGWIVLTSLGDHLDDEEIEDYVKRLKGLGFEEITR